MSRYCDYSLHANFNDINGFTLCGGSILPTSSVERAGGVNEITTPITLFTLPGQNSAHISYYLLTELESLSSYSLFVWFSLSGFTDPVYVLQQEGYFSIKLNKISNSDYLIVLDNPDGSLSYTCTSCNLVGSGWHMFGLSRTDSELWISLDHLTDRIPGSFIITLNTSLPILFGRSLEGSINKPVFSKQTYSQGLLDFVTCVIACGEFLQYNSSLGNITVIRNYKERSLLIRITNTFSHSPIDTYRLLEDSLRFVFYSNVLDEPSSYPRDVAYQVLDSGGYGPEFETRLNPIFLNDKEPVVDLNGGDDGVNFATIFVENSPGVSIIPPDAFILDQDSGSFPLTAISITLTNPIDAGDERLFTMNLPPGYVSVITDNVLEVTSLMDRSFGQWTSEILQGNVIFYINNFIEPTNGTRNISLTALEQTNGFTFTATAFIYVDILHINDEPVIDLAPSDPSTINTVVMYAEGDMDIFLLNTDISITDSDNVNLQSAFIWLTPTPDGILEYINITNDGSGTFVITRNATLISITGNATNVSYSNLLQNLVYTNLNEENPDNSTRMVSITVYDTDQQPSVTAHIFIDFEAINDAPVVILNNDNNNPFGYDTVFVEETGCVSMVGTASNIIDVDSNNLMSMAVSFREGRIDIDEFLNATFTNGLSKVSDNDGGIILTGIRSVSQYNDVLRSLEYCNFGDEPNNDTIRNVTISVTDEEGGVSDVVISEVMVERINDNPNVTVGSRMNASYGSSSEFVFGSPIIVNDVDSIFYFRALIYIFYPYDGKDFEIITFEGDLGESIISIGPNDITSGPFQGAIFYNVTFLIRVMKETVEEVIARIKYSNTAADPTTNQTRTICVSVLDIEGALSGLSCIGISINEPNVFAPEFLNTRQTLTINEGMPISSVLHTATARDLDGDLDLTFSIVSVSSVPTNAPKSGLFTIDSSANIILLQTLDAESADMYELELQVTDSGVPSKTGQARRTFMIDDINDNRPVFAAPLACSTSCSFCIDEQALFSASLVATDGDKTSPNNDIVDYNVDSMFFDINTVGGPKLENILPLDFESTPTISLTVTATDGGVSPGSLNGEISLTICLANLDDEMPTSIQRTNGVYVKGSDPVLVDQFLEVTDVDSANLDQAMVSFTNPSSPSSSNLLNCTEFCFDRRLEMCQASLTLYDLLSLGVIENNNPASGLFEEPDPFAPASCTYIRMLGQNSAGSRDLSLTAFSRVSENDLPSLVGEQVTLLAELSDLAGEGYLVSINNDSERYLSIWVQKRRLSVYYTANTIRYRWRATGLSLAGRSLFSLIVIIDPTRGSGQGAVRVYIDCNEIIGSFRQEGTLFTLQNRDLAIGKRFPINRAENRLSAGIRNLFIIPAILSDETRNCFCPCHEFIDIRRGLLASTVDVSYSTNAVILENRGNLTEFVTSIRGLQFGSFFNNPVTQFNTLFNLRSFNIFLRDISGNSATGVLLVYVANSLLPLTLDLDDSTPGNNALASFTEDTTAVAFFQNMGIQFLEGTSARPPVQILTLTLLNPLDGSREYLSAQNYLNIVASVEEHRIVFTGPGAPIHFQNALQTVTYINEEDVPDTTTRQIQASFTSVNNRNSAPSTVFLSLTEANDCPQIDLNNNTQSSISVSFTEGSPSILLFPSLSITDSDGSFILQATVDISNSTYIQGEDVLSFDSSLAPLVNATLSGDQRTIQTTLTTNLNNYETFLRSISYRSTSNPLLNANGQVVTGNDKNIILRVTDSSGSNTNCPDGLVSVLFIPIDAFPIILLPRTTINFTEESNNTVPILWDLTLSDTDSEVLGE